MSLPPNASRWTADQVAGIARQAIRYAGLITPADVRPIAPGLDVWDLWPVQEADGAVAAIGGGELWMALSAPAVGDPVERHGRARIRLLGRRDGAWRDLGPAMPDGLSPGSREWSGSAIIDAAHERVTLFFTAAGRRGEESLTYEQRMFHATARLTAHGPDLALEAWSPPRQSLASDGRLYDRADQAQGVVGQIKAFRDPGFFRDPADGGAYLLFAASLPPPSRAFNGAVGLARAADESLETWGPMPPILHAEGLNNELERPHMIAQDGLYYLFWSTQAEVFSPDGPVGPTGLYGMVAPGLLGPYEPLNGTGLVLANPSQAPFQAYSWLVGKDLTVTSFIDHVGAPGPRPPTGPGARATFGAAPAPAEVIRLDGARAW